MEFVVGSKRYLILPDPMLAGYHELRAEKCTDGKFKLITENVSNRKAGNIA